MRGTLGRGVVEKLRAWARQRFGVRSCSIDYICVWDTVASIGLPVPTNWYHAAGVPSPALRTQGIYHALALDEMRRYWQPVRFTSIGQAHQSMSREGLRLKEVWFAGVHCDVGGRYIDSDAGKLYAGISLRWMLSQLPDAFPVKPTDVPASLDASALHTSHGRFWPQRKRVLLPGDVVHKTVCDLLAKGYDPVPVTEQKLASLMQSGKLAVDDGGWTSVRTTS